MKRFLPALIAAGALIILLTVRLVLVRGVAPREEVTTGTIDSGTAPGETTFVSIGTGGMTGVYYQVGAAIMKLMNASRADHGLKVSFQSTGGSVYNINAVLSGDIDVGVAQADRQYQAVKGLGEWEDRGPQGELRFICSLYSEAVTLVAAVDSGIRTPADLRGKRVNIGNPGSGNRGNALAVLEAAGLNWETDVECENLKASEAAKLLQDGRIDAFFYTVGHPAGAITEATSGRRQVRLVPITGMDLLIERHPYYSRVTIDMSHYPKAANDGDVETIGMLTTLVTSSRVPDHVIYAMTRELFANLDTVRSMHPAFAELDPERMAIEGGAASRHPGAERYLEEAGLLVLGD